MISIVIPTLQRRLDILENLVKTLNSDNLVSEIIIINNAVKPLEFSYEKMRVITPESNIYVNPAWNLGVKEAAGKYIGLLNDDIIIADDFCSALIEKIDTIPSPLEGEAAGVSKLANVTPAGEGLKKLGSIGVIGYTRESIIPVEQGEQKPEKTDIELVKQDFIDFGFGICMFFEKESYPFIPEEIKIMYGDCWIFEKYKNNGYTNYVIKGQKIFHLGSLSTSQKTLNPVIEADKKEYNRLVYPWYKKLFSINEYADCVKLRLLGMNIKLYNKR